MLREETALTPFAEQIWDLKYRFENKGGISERSIDDTWWRVADALASVEQTSDCARMRAEFFAAMRDFQVMPAGRILAVAGTDADQTMINTFVMDDFDGSVEGVARVAQEAARTMRMGGGIGYDFSKISPVGTPLEGDKGTSSGPLAAMDVCNAVSALLSSSSRRGAMMATMRCDHPDICAFVRAKSDQTRFRNFNLSVMATDAFMQAVKDEADWPLIWKEKIVQTIPAQELWDLIMRSTFGAAEPGVLFIDRINAQNPLNYMETISATNSCAEQPLPANGSAPLASINLSRLVQSPFEAGARLDLRRLRKLAGITVRMLDNVIDLTKYPTEAQAKEARARRRIGIGVTGAANALAMVGETYGSESAAVMLETWMQEVQHATTAASVKLAQERGAFEGFCPDAYCASARCCALDPALQELVRRHGVRNALTTSVAPNGSISLLAGNVSSGIEPTFALSYQRKMKLPGGEEVIETVEDYAVKLYRDKAGADAALPAAFVTAMTLAPKDHVVMQAAVQRWVESSISKTVNCPASIEFEAFKNVYWQAYEAGCKGCTTYRPNDITGAVLTVTEDTPVRVRRRERKERANVA